MSKTIPVKVSNTHTPRSSATTAILKVIYNPTQMMESSNFQTKLQPFTLSSPVHTTQSQNTNYPRENYSTLLSGTPSPSTVKRQDNITTVQNEVNKMDAMRTEIASTHPVYHTHMRYILPQFGFNLDKMIAELANDSDKEVAALFTTTTVASTTSYIPYVSQQNWQYMFPNIFKNDPHIMTFSFTNKNTPIDSFTEQYPRTTQPIQNVSTIQLMKHEIQQQTPTIDSTENFMDERIKKLQQLKPIVLSLVRNASRNHFLRDALQTHLMESENLRPLQIHTREIPANSNKVTNKEPSTELQPQFPGYRRKVYQAKLILEELPFEDNMQVQSEIKHEKHDVETNTHASSTHSLNNFTRSSYSEVNGTPKSEQIRESSTTNSKIKPSNIKTVSNNFSKQDYSSSIPAITTNKNVKRATFLMKHTPPPVIKITYPGAVIKTVITPRTSSVAWNTNRKSLRPASVPGTTHRLHPKRISKKNIPRETTKLFTQKTTVLKNTVKPIEHYTKNVHPQSTDISLRTQTYTGHPKFPLVTEETSTINNNNIHRHM